MMNLLDIILPPSCVTCKLEGFLICENCRKDIAANPYFICPACQRRDVYGRLDKKCRQETGLTRFLGAPLLYEDDRVRKIIHAFKYQRVKMLAEPLGKILIEFLHSNNFPSIGGGHFCDFKGESSVVLIGGLKGSPPCVKQKCPPPILSPIPMINFKERERGFNQATEICKVLAKYYSLELNAKLLKKIKNTSNQADIKNKEARTKNIQGAFVCADEKYARGKIIVLVDDVYTTGSTMKECALVLRAAGAREVWGITVAR